MLFKFETITDEIWLKVERQIIKGKGAAFVTPTSLPENFPIDLPESRPCVLTNKYKDFADRIKNFEVRSDDTWVVTYPKTGTTWTQELVWLLKNNLDYETAKETQISMRFPFLEIGGLIELDGNLDTIEKAAKLSSPRCIKSHLPIQFLPEELWSVKPKIVYVKRQPKDVALSYFHHHKVLHGYAGTMEDFMDCFVRDFVLYSPFFPHVVDFCEAAEKSDNILVISFEDMKRDLASVVKTTASFLNVSISESDVGKLVEHLSFKSMRENKSVNYDSVVERAKERSGNTSDSAENFKFIRKGEVGGWKKELSPEISKQLDDWIKQNEEKNPLIKKYL